MLTTILEWSTSRKKNLKRRSSSFMKAPEKAITSVRLSSRMNWWTRLRLRKKSLRTIIDWLNTGSRRLSSISTLWKLKAVPLISFVDMKSKRLKPCFTWVCSTNTGSESRKAPKELSITFCNPHNFRIHQPKTKLVTVTSVGMQCLQTGNWQSGVILSHNLWETRTLW